jgi:hypothetical protein
MPDPIIVRAVKHQPRDPESRSPYGVGNGPLPPFKPKDPKNG